MSISTAYKPKPKPKNESHKAQGKAKPKPSHTHTDTHMQHTDNKKFLKRRNTKDFGHKLGRLVPSLACADAALIAFAYRCRLKVADGDRDGVGVLVAKSKYLPQRKKTAEKKGCKLAAYLALMSPASVAAAAVAAAVVAVAASSQF